jgi:hypothetical protein
VQNLLNRQRRASPASGALLIVDLFVGQEIPQAREAAGHAKVTMPGLFRDIQNQGMWITGHSKLLTMPMSVAARAVSAAMTSCALSKSPLPLVSN